MMSSKLTKSRAASIGEAYHRGMQTPSSLTICVQWYCVMTATVAATLESPHISHLPQADTPLILVEPNPSLAGELG